MVATDRAGNKDRSPAKRAFTVDTTPPTVTIVGGPLQGSTTGPNPTAFAFTASEPATFTCQLDGGAFAACVAPKSYPGLAEGAHTFTVRGCDALGNCAPAPAVRDWNVDATPPETTIDSGPTAGLASASNDPSFTFSADPSSGASFECALDGAAFATCVSPKSYADVAEGQRTFAVRACDPVGNCDQTPATRGWTVDTTPPDTQITGGPEANTFITHFDFEFSAVGEVADSFRCSLNGAAFSPCASPNTVITQRNQLSSYAVKACDLVQNCDPSPAVWSWTVTDPPYTAVNETDADSEADLCTLVSPLTINGTHTGGSTQVIGGLVEASRTPGAGSDPRVFAQVGRGPQGTDPRTDPGWGWLDAQFFTQVGDEDRYVAQLPHLAAGAGTYSYAFRFSVDEGATTTYCDTNGAGSNPGADFSTANLGVMTLS